MSESQTNNPKNNLKKLDNFIQESLYKYIQVKAWDELYKNTGKDHKEIISNKSTIPDLVIYNKGFNKLDCFYYPNKKRENIKFPRILFLLRPKKVKEYNPSSSNIVFNEQKKNEEKFEFKSIPKEIEDKYIGNNKEEEKNVINELNDFMKINNDKQPKINIIKGNIGNKKENDKKIGKNIAEKSQKNKFNYPNMNNSNDYYRKCMEYQNYIFQKMRYNAINNNQYLANNITNKIMEIKPISENNNIINDNLKENKPSNNFEQKGNAPDYLNFEEIMKNNMTERIWIVHNEENGLIHKYNNEELYYLLNIILKNGEFKKYSIISNKFPDIFISPEELLDILKKILQKK
jgi:hypothetical protein